MLDNHRIGWAGFRGNFQYISAGNIALHARVALFVMDYVARERLKLFGHARVAFADDEPELVAELASPDYEAVVERAVVVTAAAFDWNCPQHIMPRYTLAELEPRLLAQGNRITALEADNALMRKLLSPKS